MNFIIIQLDAMAISCLWLTVIQSVRLEVFSDLQK